MLYALLIYEAEAVSTGYSDADLENALAGHRALQAEAKRRRVFVEANQLMPPGTREVGVRMALGAGAAAVFWMILREAILLAVAGILLGVPLALALSRLVASQLFGVSPTDPLILSAAAIALSAVAILAGCPPARHATRMDPMLALRND